MLVVPCRRGGVPYLTPQMLERILDDNERLIVLSCIDAVEHMSALEATKLPFTDFCALKGYKLVLSMRSSFTGSHTSAPSNEQGIAGDHANGRVALNQIKVSEIAKRVQPTWVVPMYDAPPLDEPVSKKRRTATERSKRWLDGMLPQEGSVQTLLPSIVLMQLDGTQLEATTAVSGMVLDFSNQWETIGERLSHSCTCIERFKQLFPSVGHPMIFSQAESVAALMYQALCGVTHLECSLPWSLADNGQALVLSDFLSNSESASAILDMRDPVFRTDTSPISSHCRCYTCERHSRSYLYHLLSVQEMNSTILLLIHNLTGLVDLMRGFRRASESGVAPSFVQKAISSFGKR